MGQEGVRFDQDGWRVCAHVAVIKRLDAFWRKPTKKDRPKNRKNHPAQVLIFMLATIAGRTSDNSCLRDKRRKHLPRAQVSIYDEEPEKEERRLQQAK